jgi:UDP-glucose 4-epimerase
MNILIIGSQGFIGSGLSAFFSAKGFTVHGCDVMQNPVRDNYTLIDAEKPDFTALFRKNTFDLCINASGSGSVAFAEKNPEADRRLNVRNVELLLESIRLHAPSCRFINLSSAAVYGNPAHLPIGEEHPLEPISVYGRNKLDSEESCLEYYAKYGIGTCSLRIFSAYGPGLKKQLFWDIYRQWKDHRLVQLSGTGRETRDFIFIDDLACAVDVVMNKSDFRADVINVASGTSVTVYEAAAILLNEFDLAHKLIFSGSARPGDPLNWKADIRKLTSMGFRNRVSLHSGLHRYAQWLKKL